MVPQQKVHVVDDDLTIRILLGELFKAAKLLVETYASAEEFLAAQSRGTSGCLLLELSMPGMSGLELQELLAQQGSTTPVIFLTCSKEVRSVVRAMKAGAVDFIEKPVEPKTVLKSVNNAIQRDLLNRSAQLLRSQVEDKISLLTPREHEVMHWIVQGKPNKKIARILGISGRTVENHRLRVFEKMQAESVIDLVQMVMKAQK